MILLVAFGFTCINAQPKIRTKLIQKFFSTEVEIDGGIYIDFNKNGNIDDDEKFTPDDFKIVPEVSFAYSYEDKNHTYLTLKMIGETREYRNVFLLEKTIPGTEDITYAVTTKEGDYCFILTYAEQSGKWYFMYLK